MQHSHLASQESIGSFAEVTEEELSDRESTAGRLDVYG